MKTERRIFKTIVQFIYNETKNAPHLLVPISGGSDGAATVKICNEACPEKTIAIHAGHELLSRDWFESICPVEFIETPGKAEDAEEMRWGYFLARSLRLKGRLIGNRNRLEDLLGNYSLASCVANLLPIVNLWKSEVMDICEYIGVPEEIRASSLRPDPDCGRPPELAAIPFKTIETFLKFQIGEAELEDVSSILDRPEFTYLVDMYQHNAFTRDLPIRGPRP